MIWRGYRGDRFDRCKWQSRLQSHRPVPVNLVLEISVLGR